MFTLGHQVAAERSREQHRYLVVTGARDTWRKAKQPRKEEDGRGARGTEPLDRPALGVRGRGQQPASDRVRLQGGHASSPTHLHACAGPEILPRVQPLPSAGASELAQGLPFSF